MKTATRVLAFALLAPCAAAVIAPAVAWAQEVRTRIALTGPALQGVRPEGKADYRVDARGRRRLQVEVQAALPENTVLTVTHNGAPIGTITLVLRRGSVELATERRQNVPTIVPGSAIAVKNGAVTVVSGTF